MVVSGDSGFDTCAEDRDLKLNVGEDLDNNLHLLSMLTYPVPSRVLCGVTPLMNPVSNGERLIRSLKASQNRRT